MKKKALLTGLTGQDGSYLTELLLAKGYEVHGIIRRASTFNTDRIDHLYKDPHDPSARLFLWYGDLADSTGLRRLVEKVQPDEVYNLGAQSHVRVSFDEPEYTADVTGLGCLRLLEAVRDYRDRTSHQVLFYQASSSEMFGAAPPPQSLSTPFHPRSPYACAKVYAFWQTVNYRESYGLFACNGVLFNHECLSANAPLLVRRGSAVDVCTPDELVPLRRKGANVQTFTPAGVELWDGERWTPLRAITATKRRRNDPDHALLSIQARAGVVDVTAHHHMLDPHREVVRADRLEVGGQLALAVSYPPSPSWTVLTPEMAEFLGHMAAEGHVARQQGAIQYTNNDDRLRARVAELWSRLFLGQSYGWQGASGFSENPVGQLRLDGGRSLRGWLREQLYSAGGLKKVPPLVLNAPLDAQRAFLDGYYAGDGLKAGNGDAFKTDSALLAQGLCWLYAQQGRSCSVYVERRGENSYYQVNLSTAEPKGQKGQHLRKEPAELRRIEPAQEWDDWVFDVETGSAMLCAGVGRVVVHNSPRRGETFVTRKITRAVGRIKLGLQEKLYLGNLDARRDWGHARDYVDAMWRMLQQDTPRDYVVATGEAYSVREFAERAFALAGLDYKDFVQIDPRYFRPAEVDLLQGDPRETFERLGWKPSTSFDQLVREMVDHDLELANQERTLREAGHRVALRGVGNT